MLKAIAAVLISVCLSGPVQAAQQSSVSRTIAGHTITFTFDKAYEVGTFVNGGYWVVGPVTITGMSPSSGGAMVNPTAQDVHGLLDKYSNYQTGLDITTQLPYVANVNTSVIKVSAVTECKGWGPRTIYGQCVGALDILTVLGSVPPDNGATVFRPPYAGSNKPLRSINNVLWERLPRIQAISDHKNQSTFSGIANLWGMPNAEMIRSGASEMMRGIIAYNLFNEDYSASIGASYLQSMLSCFGTEANSEKAPAVYALMQAGFDDYEAYLLGTKFGSGAGQHLGHKPRITFAASMYDEPQMLTDIRGAAAKSTEGWFQEDKQVYMTANSTTPVWGDGSLDADHVKNYWDRFGYDGTDNNKATGDPYGYIDGPAHGINGSSYQGCCSTGPFMSYVFAQHLMPYMRYANNDWEIVEYIDRIWNGRGFDGFDGGWWGSPDPCAPKSGTRHVDYGDDAANPGDCIKNGSGRFTGDHGAAVSISRLSYLASGLWDSFRDCADPDHPSYPCTGLGAPVSTEDETPPVIQSVATPGANTEVKVLFSEPVDKTSAETAGNYSVSGGISVTGAAVASDGRTVTLTVSAMASLSQYDLTVSGVKDKADPANTIVTVTKVFQYIGQAKEIVLEAEDMTLSSEYGIETHSNGRVMIKVSPALPIPTTGTATHTFTGVSGTYDIIMNVSPENDGEPPVRVTIGSNVVLNTTFPLNPTGGHVSSTSTHDFVMTGISINNGDVIKVEGTSDYLETPAAGAFARIDYLKLIFKSANINQPLLSVRHLRGPVSVSPSPVSGTALIQLPVSVASDMTITDGAGQQAAVIKAHGASKVFMWDSAASKPGMYFYRFSHEGNTYFGKLLKVE